jgi:hypothetical protein
MSERFAAQLEARPKSAVDEWGDDPDYRAFAARMCEIVRKEIGWPSSNFVPDDPFRVVFWSYADDLESVEATIEIEDFVGFPIPDPQLERHYRGTFGAFVAELYALKNLAEPL